MLFFQALLLAGYAYAHALASRKSLLRQAWVHICLAAATVLTVLWFTVVPSQAWRPAGGSSPVLGILGLLAASIGAPFFLLSSTAPLLQFWFSSTHPGSPPYRLYALSNLGSLLALLSYPFLIEPALRLGRQASIWSLAYCLFGGAVILVSLQLFKSGGRAILPGQAESAISAPDKPGPGPGRYALWLGLTVCSSVMLLATTGMLCQDLAVVPLLWILPLAIYLLSFVICFQHERLYWRPLFIGGLAASIAWTCEVLYGSVWVALRWQILSYSLTLLATCMVCHGELVR
jgi:hypothetical protein